MVILMIDWIVDAAAALDQQIRPTVVETPLVERRLGKTTVLCKQENLQTTGSFKIRGAMAKLLALSAGDRARGVIAASTGNHGVAVGRAGGVLGAAVTVYVPETAQDVKLAAISAAGAAIIKVPGDPVASEIAARQAALDHGLAFVSPYNDRYVIAGQSTVAVELLRQIGPTERVIVAVGGGGLISGIGAVIKQAWPGVEVVAASPVNSPAMHRSIEAGRIVEVPTLPTLSDGTAGGIEPGSITFELCQKLVDGWVLVTEDEIASAVAAYPGDDPIEGSAGVALAAAGKLDATPTVVVLCGGNASAELR
jgi:threonine dehydratase